MITSANDSTAMQIIMNSQYAESRNPPDAGVMPRHCPG